MNIQILIQTLEKNYVFTSEIDNLCIWLYKYILLEYEVSNCYGRRWKNETVASGNGNIRACWGALRLFSGSAEIFAALLMLYVNDAKKVVVYKWYVGVCWTYRINFNNDNWDSECS